MPACGRHALVDRDVRALRCVPVACCSARAARSTRSSAGSGGAQVFAAERAAGAQLEVQRVVPVDQHEDRLQQVVAVGAPAGDVQEQVELGRRRRRRTALACALSARTPRAGRPRGGGVVRCARRRPSATWRQVGLPAGHRRVARRPASRTGPPPASARRWPAATSASTEANCRARCPGVCSVAAPGAQCSTASVPPSGLNSVSSPACGRAPAARSRPRRTGSAGPAPCSARRPLQRPAPGRASSARRARRSRASRRPAATPSSAAQAARGRALMA